MVCRHELSDEVRHTGFSKYNGPKKKRSGFLQSIFAWRLGGG